MTAVQTFDDRPCALGEGPLWHPERGQLFWFDILGKALLTRSGTQTQRWDMGAHASAAGWVDRDRLLVATEAALVVLDLTSGAQQALCPLEADLPANRSNDGRADPWGGFWIGTMAKDGAPGAGAIYRWYRGDLRRLHAPLSIPNAICFSPDRRHAYFADTRAQTVWRQALAAADGWPCAAAEVWLDLRNEGLKPDGAVCDAAGNLWIAQWDAGRVACHGPDGGFLRSVALPAMRTTCPAFGGPDLTTLHVTSAREGLSPAEIAAEPRNGMTLAVSGLGPGLPEPRVIL